MERRDPQGREDNPSRPAIDIDHLKRQTFGDGALQRQVLELFARQAAEHLDRLKGIESPDERRMLAHTLVGSARGVGAFAVAEIAAGIERGHGPARERLADLERAVDDVRRFIAVLLTEE